MAKHSMLFFCFSGLQNVVKNGKTSTDILCPKALNVYPKPLDVRSELVNAHPKALNRDFATMFARLLTDVCIFILGMLRKKFAGMGIKR